MASANTTPQWQALESHAAGMRDKHLRDLFAGDPQRSVNFSRTADLNLLFDFSRQRLDAKTLQLLIELANARGLRERIDAMFRGEKGLFRAATACWAASASFCFFSAFYALDSHFYLHAHFEFWVVFFFS